MATNSTATPIPFANLTLLPSLLQAFETLFSSTGLQSFEDFVTRIKALLGTGNLLDEAQVTGLINDINSMFTTLGSIAPNSNLSAVPAKIAEYEKGLEAIAASQPVQVADVFATVNGTRYELDLNLTVKPAPAV